MLIDEPTTQNVRPDRDLALSYAPSTTEPGVAAAEPSVTATEPGVTAAEPSVTATEPGVTAAEPDSSPPEKSRSGIAQRVLQAMSWVVFGRILSIGMNVLVGILVARLVAPAEYGRFELLCSVIAFGSTITTLGMNVVVVRVITESMALCNLARARAALRSSVVIAIIGGGLTITMAPALLRLLAASVEVTLPLVLLVGVGAAVLGWQRLACMALQSMNSDKWAHSLGSGQTGGGVSSLLFVAGFAGLMAMHYQLGMTNLMFAFVGALAITAALAIVATWKTAGHVLTPHGNAVAGGLALENAAADDSTLSIIPYRELVWLASQSLFIQLMSSCASQADTWLAASYASPDDLALFVASRRIILLVALPLQFATISVTHIIPRLFVQKKFQQLQHTLQTAAALAGIPSLVGLLMMAAAGDQIMSLIYGASYGGAYWPLVILGCGQFAFVAVGTCSLLLFMTGHHGVVLTIETLALLLMVVLAPWFAAVFGIAGIAAASAISLGLKSIAFWLAARKLTGIWTHPSFALS